MTFHQKIRILCGEKGLTQTALALLIDNASRATVARWFTGSEPSLSQAAKLAHVLGVSMEYLADEQANYPVIPSKLPSGSVSSVEELRDTPDIRMIVSAIGREEALDRLLLRRREAVAG